MKDKQEKSRRRFILSGIAVALPLLKSDAGAEECRPTERNALGPYYRNGAPWRTALSGPDEPGEPLSISGRVIAAETCRPLKGATVDVWQANAAGLYDNEDRSNPPDPGKFFLRGQMKTDPDGRYRFETILPGNYQDGRRWRAKHIHYIVSCPGYAPLTTQCYFEGDPYNDGDRLVKTSLITRVTRLNLPGSERRRLEGTFDVVLTRAE